MHNKNQLFFLHFAGGNCYSYNYLLTHLAGFEIHQLELPGRGKRMDEDFLPDREAAAEDYCKQILNLRNGAPFVIFGHSMGASLGHEAIALLEKKAVLPKRLIASGNAGPKIRDPKTRHLLEKDAFIAELKDIGGMPASFFEHEDLVEFFLPVLKSDFKVIEIEKREDYPVIQTPITAIMGTEEDNVEDIDNWKNYTKGDFEPLVLSGNHFFIHDHPEKLAKIITESFLG